MNNFHSGTWLRQQGYRSFQPSLINRQWVVDDMEIQTLLSEADHQLGRLDMLSGYVPNIELYIRMHVIKEATQSSRIEGTRTRVDEAIMEEEDVPPERRDDWQEVQNYIAAMDAAITRLDDLPISSRLIREAHRTLMRGVRGEHKTPGEFRKSQNWIGGASIQDAIFVPPDHDSLPELMSDLEEFLHNKDIHMPELLRIALIHYQFETIHPFLDGNGRIGRLLIPLYLVQQTILEQPVLYLSDFLERNREHYYDNLMRVRRQNDLGQWFRFFLVGMIETARSGIETFDSILQLKQQAEAQVRQLGNRAGNANRVLEALYRHPLIDAEGVASVCDVSQPTAYRLIADLERLDILHEVTGARRGRMWQFRRYVRLFL